MSDRTGFVARGFSRLGPLTVTHGLGNPGSPPFFFLPGPVVPDDHVVDGTIGPRVLVADRRAPRVDIYYPKAKKKKCKGRK